MSAVNKLAVPPKALFKSLVALVTLSKFTPKVRADKDDLASS